MKKKLLIITLMLACIVTANANRFVVDGFAYEVLSDGISVEVEPNKYDKNHLTAIRIPSYVTYNGTTYTVTSIHDYTFNGCSEAISIELPPTLTTIKAGAFQKCTSLTSVTIPSGITYIGDDIFKGCVKLKTLNYNAINVIRSSSDDSSMCGWENCKIESINIGSGVQTLPIGFAAYQAIKSITIPSSVKTIDKSAFFMCQDLTSISIPSSVTTIGANAFCWTGLTNVSIPSMVKNLGSTAFAHCKKLEKVTIQSSGIIVGKGCFEDCENLKNVINSDNILRVRESAFKGCTSLSSISLNGADTIGVDAFKSCNSMSKIIFGNLLKVIDDEAFSGCSVVEITIPKNLQYIGYQPFANCYSLKRVDFNAKRCETNIDFRSDQPGFLGNSPVQQLVFGADVEYIAPSLAAHATSLKEIYIPANVTEVCVKAFWGCTSVSKITIDGEDLKFFRGQTFRDCSNVQSIYFPKGDIKGPGVSQFIGLTKLKEIYCPREMPYSIGFGDTDWFAFLDTVANTAFAFLPVIVAISAARVFGGNIFLGAVIGLLMIHGAFLNGWNVGSAENVSKFFGLTSPEMVSWVVKEFGEKAAAAAPQLYDWATNPANVTIASLVAPFRTNPGN